MNFNCLFGNHKFGNTPILTSNTGKKYCRNCKKLIKVKGAKEQ